MIKAELEVAALAMKEATLCSNMILEIDFNGSFGSVPLYTDNTPTLHVAGSHTYGARAKHVALRYVFVQEVVGESKISIHYVKTEGQLAGLGTKHLSKHRYRDLMYTALLCRTR